jgi:hypothetical protein
VKGLMARFVFYWNKVIGYIKILSAIHFVDKNILQKNTDVIAS